MSALPHPLTPPECDLQDFPFMALHVSRLRDSTLAATASPEACWYAVLLWCASWHQKPAASLPDDDATLCRLAGLGRDLRTWKKNRAESLHGFVKCSDGRLYHPVVAERANEAWKAKLEQRFRTECARIKKHNQRYGTDIEAPDFNTFVANGCARVPLDNITPSRRNDVDVPDLSPGTASGQSRDKEPMSLGKTAPKGEGEGEGEGYSNNDCLVEGACEILEDENGSQLGPPDDPDPPTPFEIVCDAAGFYPTRAETIDAAEAALADWLAKGHSLDDVILPAIRSVMAKSDGPTSSLARFNRAVEHEAARRKATAAKPAQGEDGDAPVALMEGEDEAMLPVREALRRRLGARTYRLMGGSVKLEAVPEMSALKVKQVSGVRLCDGERIAFVKAAAAECGFTAVWPE